MGKQPHCLREAFSNNTGFNAHREPIQDTISSTQPFFVYLLSITYLRHLGRTSPQASSTPAPHSDPGTQAPHFAKNRHPHISPLSSTGLFQKRVLASLKPRPYFKTKKQRTGREKEPVLSLPGLTSESACLLSEGALCVPANQSLALAAVSSHVLTCCPHGASPTLETSVLVMFCRKISRTVQLIER